MSLDNSLPPNQMDAWCVYERLVFIKIHVYFIDDDKQLHKVNYTRSSNNSIAKCTTNQIIHILLQKLNCLNEVGNIAIGYKSTIWTK